MTKRQRLAAVVLRQLESIRDDGPPSLEVGICWNLKNLLRCYFRASDYEFFRHREFWREETRKVFANWQDPASSGDDTYPIKEPGGLSYETATVEQIWVSGEYAEARHRLLAALIEHFKNIVENPDA